MEIIILAVVFFISGIVSEIIGFGIATISMSILPFILPLDVVIPLVAITAMIATGIVAFQTKSKDVFKHITPLLAGSVIGVVIGMFFLNVIDKKILSAILGLFLIAYALYGTFIKKHYFHTGKKLGIFIGILSGFFGSFLNIHGPFVGIYSSSDGRASKEDIKDMIATYIFITGLLTITGHALAERVTKEVLTYFLISLPFLILGLLTGTKLFKNIDAKTVKYGVYLFVFIAGTSLLFLK